MTLKDLADVYHGNCVVIRPEEEFGPEFAICKLTEYPFNKDSRIVKHIYAGSVILRDDEGFNYEDVFVVITG